ncbi:TetR/AcrR family transcriptional regulator [Nocardioides humilatus]|uniref:TetR/AcrR family transcriptional regulator n=1 Tax=Nocardioides humilatus TaxID=2607660 RepID=A0A5B1LE01_9ACTN|nr:TetR/AcrR family transcriptional regulator [Nocardioides humilatus]KAA1418953.1 TetR/AcrR family transcriptional regulator [Nocardioides humilatus]
MDEQAAPRRGRPGYDQATVLRRAIELFNQKGYDGTSIGDLASELGLSKSAIYHHVPSKEHLLQQALDEALGALTEALDRIEAASGLTATERLRTAVRTSVVVLVEHLPAVTLLLRVHGNSAAEQDALARRRALDDRLAAMVRAAAADGELRDDIAPDLLSRLLFGMVNSLVEWVRPGHDESAEHLADALAALAFEGLLR